MSHVKMFKVHNFMGNISDHCMLSTILGIEATKDKTVKIYMTDFPKKVYLECPECPIC